MIPIDRKFALTVAEAAAFFNIGEKKIRKMANENPNAYFVLWNGTKLLIKRQAFEKYLNATNTI